MASRTRRLQRADAPPADRDLADDTGRPTAPPSGADQPQLSACRRTASTPRPLSEILRPRPRCGRRQCRLLRWLFHRIGWRRIEVRLGHYTRRTRIGRGRWSVRLRWSRGRWADGRHGVRGSRHGTQALLHTSQQDARQPSDGPRLRLRGRQARAFVTQRSRLLRLPWKNLRIRPVHCRGGGDSAIRSRLACAAKGHRGGVALRARLYQRRTPPRATPRRPRLLGRWEWSIGGSAQDRSSPGEPGAVARAVPRSGQLIPSQITWPAHRCVTRASRTRVVSHRQSPLAPGARRSCWPVFASPPPAMSDEPSAVDRSAGSGTGRRCPRTVRGLSAWPWSRGRQTSY